MKNIIAFLFNDCSPTNPRKNKIVSIEVIQNPQFSQNLAPTDGHSPLSPKHLIGGRTVENESDYIFDTEI